MNRFATLLVIIFLFACKKNTVIEVPGEQRLITKIEGSTRGAVGQPVILTLSWAYYNGCQALDKFVETTQGNTRSIWSYGSPTPGVCTQDAGIKTKSYTFTAAMAGEYELRFYNLGLSFISHIFTIY